MSKSTQPLQPNSSAKDASKYNPYFYPDRKNPNYPENHCFTVATCSKCGEFYEPICSLEHICKKQNSYPISREEDKDEDKI